MSVLNGREVCPQRRFWSGGYLTWLSKRPSNYCPHDIKGGSALLPVFVLDQEWRTIGWFL